jgi:hypothetical protein
VPQGKSASEVVEDAQEGVKVPDEQELPDGMVQSEAEVREKLEQMSVAVPVGHPEVGEGAGCPMGFR